MALAECNRCGWTEEVQGESDDEEEFRVLEAYARHVWEVHPQLAPHDSVAAGYVRFKASIFAPTNGSLGRPR